MRTWSLVGVVGLVAACASEAAGIPPSDAGPECASGTSQGCSCQGGLSGIRECRNQRWAECFCIPPSGSGEAEAGADADCAQRGRYFVDADGDGFGAGPQVDACEPTGPGYSTVAGDCDDGDARAFPGQSEPQEGLRKGIGGGDFNCDGVETLLWTNAGQCTGCTVGSKNDFWEANTAPPCGGSGTWVTSCVHVGGGVCDATSAQRAQRCL